MFSSMILACVLSQPPAMPIRSVDLQPESVPVSAEPRTFKLKPGQIKAFASGPQTRWIFSPVSTDATRNGLVLEDASAGAIVFAFDVDRGQFGRFKVPETVVIVACNQGAKGTYRLDKIEASVKDGVVDVKIVDQTYIVADSGDKPKPDDKPDDKPEPKPEPKPDVDAELVAKFRSAVAADGDKIGAARLGGVYESFGGLMVGTSDPAALPATVGQVRETLFTNAEEAGVPRLPALQNVRGVVVLEVGKYANETPTRTVREQLGRQFLRIGSALKEAAK